VRAGFVTVKSCLVFPEPSFSSGWWFSSKAFVVIDVGFSIVSWVNFSMFFVGLGLASYLGRATIQDGRRKMKKFDNLTDALKALNRAVGVFAICASSDDYHLVEGALEALRFIEQHLEPKQVEPKQNASLGGSAQQQKENKKEEITLAIKIFID
jgi:hypothetical protein